jgi:hypothetical protein
MGTSNWQNIPFCVEVLMKIKPHRVLDTNIRSGSWGAIIRDLFDIQLGQVPNNEWTIQLDGIDAFPQKIDLRHKTFYNKIHVGLANEILPSLSGKWDLVIFDNVLEFLDHSTSEKLLRWSKLNSCYTLVTIPLNRVIDQESQYEKSETQYLSSWIVDDFISFHICQKFIFSDSLSGALGTFVLSRDDPYNLKNGLTFQIKQGENRETKKNVDETALLTKIQTLTDELNGIKNARSFRIVQRLKQSPFGKLLHYASTFVMPEPREIQQIPATTTSHQAIKKIQQFSEDEKAWIEHQINTKLPVVLCNPEWRGIRSSANELFEEIYYLKDNLDQESANHYAQLFIEANCHALVIQGFPLTYFEMVHSLHKMAPKLPIFVIWHGSFLQAKEDYNWTGFQTILQLQKDGDVSKIGFVKQGMAEIMAKSGYRTGFVMNRVRRIPEAPSVPFSGGPHIGIWSIPDWGWLKPPYAMIAATALIPEVTVYAHHVSPRAKEFSAILKINLKGPIDSVLQAEMPNHLSKMHLNLNVTLSECAPMLPLESLSVGVPCLFSPTSYYFKDHDYLHQILIVPYPEDAVCIAKYAAQAIDERDEIVKAYIKYAPDYNNRAIKSLEDFLEMPLQSNQ